MRSDEALPVDVLGSTNSNGVRRPQSQISQLLARTEPESRRRVNYESIDGYTTIDVGCHDEAVEIAGAWRWTGGVRLLPMHARPRAC